MLHKYFIFIFCMSATNVVGENDDQSIRNMSATWKAEIEETLTDKLVERLQNKVTNVLEMRLVLDFEKILEEKLVINLEQKLNKKVEENLEKKMEAKLEKILAIKLEKTLEKKLEGILKSALEAKLALSLEEKLTTNLESKLAENIKDKLQYRLEQKLGDQLEPKLETKLEYIIEDKLEVRMVKKIEEKLDTKLEDKLTGKLKDKLSNENIEKKLTNTLQVLLDKKLENKFKEIENTYRYNITDNPSQKVEWIKTKPMEALSLRDCAVVGGYEADGSLLWVMRASFNKHLIPGKLALDKQSAFISWDGQVHISDASDEIEVFCASPYSVRWLDRRDGAVPPCAVEAGKTTSGDTLYVGRAIKEGALIPGKVHPEYKCLYISYGSKEICIKDYEVLCVI